MAHMYDQDLGKTRANYQALSPLTYLERAAEVFPERAAIIHGDTRFTYAQFYSRCRRLASALQKQGVSKGDTVSIIAPNVPAMLDCHYGVPMTGAVLNTINTRLDAANIAFILDHGEAKVLVVDREFSAVAAAALKLCKAAPLVIDIDDPMYDGGSLIGEMDYETFLECGAPDFTWEPPGDEWDSIALNYTSGTTGDPKGVVFSHRGACLLALGNVITTAMGQHPVYLWTLPMFHCNGWCFTWALSVVAGTHVCLRKVEARGIFDACATHKITHMCGAPIIMNMIVNAAPEDRKELQRINFFTAAAPPPAATIAAMETSGFDITHIYGLTETYGPAVINAWREEWNDLPVNEQAEIKARQGVRYEVLEGLSVRDPETMEETPSDGVTIGEVMFRGNAVMKGYLKNPKATEACFKGGWFHSGDLGVRHEDGYIQLKDRSKDIIISGGENISSIEVEDALYKHEAIMEAAVVARPDPKWGETPCAFVSLKPGHKNISERDLIDFCRENLAHFKCPKHVVFGDLPKTSTGKIQKFKLRDRVPV